jgi:hypothetical protein
MHNTVEPKPMMTELVKRSANREGPEMTSPSLRTSLSYQVVGSPSACNCSGDKRVRVVKTLT